MIFEMLLFVVCMIEMTSLPMRWTGTLSRTTRFGYRNTLTLYSYSQRDMLIFDFLF